MPELADKQPSGGESALTAGCLMLLVLVADVAAGLLVVIVLAVRGLGRMDAGSGQTVTSVSPRDWAPVLGFGALALAGRNGCRAAADRAPSYRCRAADALRSPGDPHAVVLALTHVGAAGNGTSPLPAAVFSVDQL
ncbi:hypothetical protein ACWCQP_44550 [Streptomyces chartreusis]